jgi:hypothetical protein
MFRRLLGTLALTAAMLVPAAPALADTGGGCQQLGRYSNPWVCISVAAGTTNPLRGDAYLNNRLYNETYADVYVRIRCSDGGWHYSAPARWNLSFTHSPVVTMNKPCAHGYAYTHVEFFTSSGFLYPSFSPNQNW